MGGGIDLVDNEEPVTKFSFGYACLEDTYVSNTTSISPSCSRKEEALIEHIRRRS